MRPRVLGIASLPTNLDLLSFWRPSGAVEHLEPLESVRQDARAREGS